MGGCTEGPRNGTWAHCGRSTARRRGGGWCRRWSREPCPVHTAPVTAAGEAVSPRAPPSAQTAGGGELASAARSRLCRLCPPPLRSCLWLDVEAQPHALLTTFLISEAWRVGSKGKMTVFFSALRSGSRVLLPWKEMSSPRGALSPSSSALLEKEATQGTRPGTLGQGRDRSPASSCAHRSDRSRC